MLARSAKAKGRRLQVFLAEVLSSSLGLSIQASPPTRPGRRGSGAVYVAEDSSPDILVRQMSSPGIDVALLTDIAKAKVGELFGVVKIAGFECKNDETLARPLEWPFGRNVECARLGGIISKWEGSGVLLCLGGNRKPPIVLVPRGLGRSRRECAEVSICGRVYGVVAVSAIAELA